ncbi:MAG: glycerol-3-phosphate 1-O-acyltransferase PlsY [Pseudomonadota bacterium]
MTWAEVLATLLPDVLSWERGWPYYLGAIAFGYACGSIPFGVIVSRVMNLGDLRSIGSGNIGATNVLRTGNKGAAAATLALDMVKGWAPVAIMLMMWGDLTAQLAAIGAVLGHLFPVWLSFKGGKGVATFIGVTLGLGVFAGLLACASWLAAAALFRISSLAALIMTALTPVWLWVVGERGAIWAIVLIAPLIWQRHGENITRLLAGEEPKIGK